jgi:hypothetical protein
MAKNGMQNGFELFERSASIPTTSIQMKPGEKRLNNDKAQESESKRVGLRFIKPGRKSNEKKKKFA